MGTLAVYGDYVVTVDENRRIIRDGAVVVQDDRIEFVGKAEEARQKFGPFEVELGGPGRLVFPGLVNGHDHMFQTLIRTLAVDRPLLEWLRSSVWPMLAELKAEDVRVSSKLGIIENLKSGVTTVIDNHYGGRYYDEVLETMIESGIRGCVPRGGYEINAHEPLLEDFDTIISDAERLIKKYHGAENGRIMVGIAPMHPCFASDEFLLKAKELSDKYEVPLHVHTGESLGDQELQKKVHGKTDVEYLHDLGVLGPRYHAVHGVWVSEKEIKMLAEAGAHVIHNPVSNMYIASGIAPIPEMMWAGVNVALGTDGPASNDNQDLITSMKFAALLHKVAKLDASVITAWDVLEMATINGARALSREKEFGSLEVGKKADIMVLNAKKPWIWPVHDPVGSLVYSATIGDVESVVVDGRVLMQDGQILVYDEAAVLEEARKVAERMRETFKSKYGAKFEYEDLLE
ncbi:MAG TPA: amidohydrolase [Candidatus Korarchaeota archaeon]|nr:amidohydrolase [Candidatus Korarchaeota archaeon]